MILRITKIDNVVLSIVGVRIGNPSRNKKGLTICFGCAQEIEGKPFQDRYGKTKLQDKPIYDNEEQPNCISCFMYFIGMEYRKEYLKIKKEKKRNKKELL